MTSSATSVAAPVLSGRRVTIVFAGVLLGATLSGLDGAIVATAAPTILSELGSLSLLPWLTTSYLLAQVTTMALYGKVGDTLGRKRVFAFAIALFIVGSMLCGAAQTMPMLIAFRVLQGVGAGGITGLAMSLVAEFVPADRLGRYLGYTGIAFAVTSVLGPSVGGFFVDHLSWRWAFFVNLPSGILCLLTLLLVPRSPRNPHRLDLVGAGLLAGAAASLLLAIGGTGGRLQWISLRTIGLGSFAVVLAILFVMRQNRISYPLMPMRIFLDRVTALGIAGNLTTGVAFGTCIVYPPVFFEAVSGMDATHAGLMVGPFALTSAAMTMVAGQITDRFGGHKLLPVIGSIECLVGFLMLSAIGPHTSGLYVVLSAMVVGAGIGFVMQTLLYVIQRSTKPSEMGVVTSVTMLARVFGNSMGVAIVGSVFTAALYTEVAVEMPGTSVEEIQAAPQKIIQMSVEAREAFARAFSASLSMGFRAVVPIMVIGIVCVVAIPARKVRSRLQQPAVEVPLADIAAHGG